MVVRLCQTFAYSIFQTSKSQENIKKKCLESDTLGHTTMYEYPGNFLILFLTNSTYRTQETAFSLSYDGYADGTNDAEMIDSAEVHAFRPASDTSIPAPFSAATDPCIISVR